MLVSDFIIESGGYIPQNEREAHDPRFEMAITCDVKPGEVSRQAEKFGFKIKKNSPPILRSNGTITEYVKPQENPAFKAWFGNSKVVDSHGNPQIVYHGTTHTFTSFSNKKGNPENYYGKGYYFTSSQMDTTNYAGKGPDLKGRIENRADQIMNDLEYQSDNSFEYNSPEYKQKYDQAVAQAEKELMGEHGGIVMPCYLKIQKPIIVQKNGGTYFDFIYDEKTNKEFGSGVKLYNAIRSLHLDADLEGFGDEIANLGSEFSAYEFEIIARQSRFAEEILDLDVGGIGSVLGAIYKKMGFDGIILDAASSNFGSGMLSLMDRGTKHYIVWNPNQIKSALGNAGTYNARSKNILASKDIDSDCSLFEALIDNKVGLGYHPYIHTNINRNGIPVLMKPSVYLSLVAHIVAHEEPSRQQWMNDHVKSGKSIASPTIRFDLPKSWLRGDYTKPAIVRGHEGRHRMKAILQTEGDNFTEVIVRFSLEDSKYHDDIPLNQVRPSWLRQINSKCITQDDWMRNNFRPINGPFFKLDKNPLKESPNFGYSQYHPDMENKFDQIDWRIIPYENGYKIYAIDGKSSNRSVYETVLGMLIVESWHRIGIIKAAIIYNSDWKGTGLGQTMYDKAIQYAKKNNFTTFRSDIHRTSNSESAWKKLSNRYPVRFIKVKNQVEKPEFTTYYSIDLSKVPMTESIEKYTKKTDFRFKGGAMLMQRVGPINAQRQTHNRKDELNYAGPAYKAPTNRGMWAFPYPAFDNFFVGPKRSRMLPKRLQQPYIDLEIEKMKSPEARAVLWAEREKAMKEIVRKTKPRLFWWSGPIYSRIAPEGESGKQWYLWTDLKAWAKKANASMVAEPLRNKDKSFTGRWVTYTGDHLELFLPMSGNITRKKIKEAPDFGYSKFNDREKEFKDIQFSIIQLADGFAIAAHLLGNELGYVKMRKGTNTYFKNEGKFTQKRIIRVAKSDIQPSWRGTGLGQTLYDKAIQEAKRRGYKFLRSDVLRSGDADKAWEKLSKRYPVETIQSDTMADYTAYQIDLSKVEKAA